MKSLLNKTLPVKPLLAAALVLGASSQLAEAQCIQGSSQAMIESGNIRATVLNGGDMFWDLNNASFEVPKGSGKHSIFAGGLWFGGIDSATNQLNLAAQTYRQANEGGYWPGAIPASGSPSASICTDFDFHAKITRQTIDDYRALVNGMVSMPVPETQIPLAIKNWPGKGNPFRSNISSASAGQLAPFFDTDWDGIYDPRNGDYPVILGDEAVWYVMNDVAGIKQPVSPALGLEVHVMLYGFHNTGNPALENTLFAQYTFINRGDKKLEDTYFGNWVDFDLGYYLDDYVGSDPARSLFYVYNADNNDEGAAGYGLNPPAQGVIFLNMPLTNFSYWENDATVYGNPQSATEYYSYMQSKWRNGNPMTEGGNGIGGTTPTNFMFPGNPNDPAQWSEVSAGIGGGDRRGLGAHGPFTFAPGQIMVMDVAYPWAQGSNNLTSVTALLQTTDEVINFYNTVLSAPAAAAAPALSLAVYPNPAGSKAHVQLSSSQAATATLTLRDLTGRTVQQQTVQLQQGANQVEMNLEAVPQGLYLIQLQNGSQSYSARIVKQ